MTELRGELVNILVLTLLYCLQGIPLGLSMASLPFILKKHLSFTQIGIFSLAAYPFSLKFLWSPMVDSYFVKSWGRRKSWIVPLQLLSGALMVLMSYYVDEMLVDPSYVYQLTLCFFMIIVLYATQDIAVDGWALEILSPQNKALASTCQSVGQNAGFFLSFTVLLALNSSEFCNKYIFAEPRDHGLVEVSQYLYFWGLVNLGVSFYIWLFKHEAPPELGSEQLGFKSIYTQIYKFLKLPSVQLLIAVLLTSRIALSAHDNALGLVIIDKGFPEAQLGIIAVFQLPFDILFSILIGWKCRGGNELKIYFVGFCLRLVLCFYGVMLLWIYPGGEPSNSFYALLVFGSILTSIGANCMFVSICAFFNKIADERIGGSMLTFLNTVLNFGSTWPKLFVLWGIENWGSKGFCRGTFDYCYEECECEGGVHGYYPVTFCSMLFGVAYLGFLFRSTQKLGNSSSENWDINYEEIANKKK
mmetsp:Transcript_10165/g.15201  ORF Transcript_10165/g.15201 Transcript_10165/m.15201 type:complete len:473 (+) Transcript_10165:7-1425(+)